MTLEQNLRFAEKAYPISVTPSAQRKEVDPPTEFDDRLWRTAEAVIANGASSISVVAEAASLVRRQSEKFASILSGARYLKSLGEDAGSLCKRSFESDIAHTEDRLILQLKRDLLNL